MKKLITLCAFSFFALTAKAQLSTGLIAHWTFTGHTNDITAGAHHATPYNITYGKGKAGSSNTAAFFNGTSSYAETVYKPDLNIDTYSICAIIKPMGYYTGTCQGNYVLSRGNVSASGGYGLCYFDQAYNDCSVTDTSVEVFSAMARQLYSGSSMQYTPNIVSNTWYCVVATYTGDTAKVYVNGTLKSTTVTPNSGIGISSAGLSIGAYSFGFPNFPYWVHGYIDDLRLYKRALSAADAALYCESEIIEKPLNTESIEKYGLKAEVNIYPNPNNGNFTIAAENLPAGAKSIGLYNTLGQCVYNNTVQGTGNTTLEVSTVNLPSGTYSLRIKMAEGTISKTISIQQ